MMREVEVGATSRDEDGGRGVEGWEEGETRERSRPGSGQLSRDSIQKGRGEGWRPRRGEWGRMREIPGGKV